MGGLGGCTGGQRDSESGHRSGRGAVGPGWTGVPGGCATFPTLCPLPCHFPPRQRKRSGAGSVSHFLLPAPAVSGHVRPAPCARPCPCPHCAPQQPPHCPVVSQGAAPRASCVLVTLSACQVLTDPCLALPQSWHWGGSRAGQALGMSLCPLAWAGGLSPLMLWLCPCRLPAFPGFCLQPGRGGQAPDGILRGGETGGPRGQILCAPGVGLVPPGPRAPCEVTVPREVGDTVQGGGIASPMGHGTQRGHNSQRSVCHWSCALCRSRSTRSWTQRRSEPPAAATSSTITS